MRCLRQNDRLPKLPRIAALVVCITLIGVGFEATTATAPSQTRSAKFAATSVRSIPAGTPIPAQALGIACHGADGIRQTVTASKLGVDPVLAPPRGRCTANGVTLLSVIAFAYGIPEGNVSGGPDWIRHSGPIGLDPGTFTFRATETFVIEAVSEDPALARTEELRPMLQTMLAERFNLKVHRETRQIQGHAVVTAKDGPKIKEASGPYESPRVIFDETLRRSIKGTSRLNQRRRNTP